MKYACCWSRLVPAGAKDGSRLLAAAPGFQHLVPEEAPFQLGSKAHDDSHAEFRLGCQSWLLL